MEELFKICQKNITKEIRVDLENKTYKLAFQKYIMDNKIFMYLLPLTTKELNVKCGIDIIYLCEQECEEDNLWGSLYMSPIDDLISCDLVILKNQKDFENLIENQVYNNLEIEDIIVKDRIIIKLK